MTFAYRELARDIGPFVVFGHSLGHEDAHIARALNRPGLTVAVGIRSNKTPAQVANTLAHYDQVLATADRLYFDAQSHPLG